MPRFIPENLTGRMFDNRQDKTSKKQPDCTGTVNIDGVIYRVAAWYNPPSEKARTSSYSLRFVNLDEYEEKKRNSEQQQAAHQPNSAPAPEGGDDDIPF